MLFLSFFVLANLICNRQAQPRSNINKHMVTWVCCNVEFLNININLINYHLLNGIICQQIYIWV